MGEQDAGPSGATATRRESKRLRARLVRASATRWAWRSAKRTWRAVFNRDQKIIDHNVYFIASDGDMMEGISHEAASFAGHIKLGKFIGFYDDNHITIEGDTALTFSDDTAARFEAYGWHVQHVEDVNDLAALDRAIEAAKAETSQPSLIIVRSHIGFGSPHKHDTAEAHGSPLGVDEIKLTKEALGYPSQEPFYVAPEALRYWREAAEQRARSSKRNGRSSTTRTSRRTRALEKELERRLRGDLLDGWEELIPDFHRGGRQHREPGGFGNRDQCDRDEDARADRRIGGSRQLHEHDRQGRAELLGRRLRWPKFPFRNSRARNGRDHERHGVHGGIIPYGATFLIFSDYMRPPIRLACIMKQHVIYVYTHDSIGLGEDGPTHQPIEQLSALRAIPDMTVIRPADASETAEAWRAALKHKGPVALVLTRQKLSFIDRTKYAAAAGLARGAYVLADSPAARRRLCSCRAGRRSRLSSTLSRNSRAAGIRSRAVSMPSMEMFARSRNTATACHRNQARCDRGRAPDVMVSVGRRRWRNNRHRALWSVGARCRDLHAPRDNRGPGCREREEAPRQEIVNL